MNDLFILSYNLLYKCCKCIYFNELGIDYVAPSPHLNMAQPAAVTAVAMETSGVIQEGSRKERKKSRDKVLTERSKTGTGN